MATDQNVKNKTLASEIDTAYGRYIVDLHVSHRRSLFLHFCIYLFLSYKCKRKSLMGNLFGRLCPEDIPYCHS